MKSLWNILTSECIFLHTSLSRPVRQAKSGIKKSRHREVSTLIELDMRMPIDDRLHGFVLLEHAK